MAKDWTRKISDQKNVVLEVSLPDLFSGKYIPNSNNLRQAIGQEIIDIIRERTQKDERSWTGSSFANYSEDYTESVEFKAYDKSKTEPNLTQSGDMLGLMTILDSTPDKIVIGWNDTLQSEKAHGHITGNVGRKRDFFGLNQGELKTIKDKFGEELEEAPINPTQDNSTVDLFAQGEVQIPNRSLNQVIDLFFGTPEDE